MRQTERIENRLVDDVLKISNMKVKNVESIIHWNEKSNFNSEIPKCIK